MDKIESLAQIPPGSPELSLCFGDIWPVDPSLRVGESADATRTAVPASPVSRTPLA